MNIATEGPGNMSDAFPNVDWTDEVVCLTPPWSQAVYPRMEALIITAMVD